MKVLQISIHQPWARSAIAFLHFMQIVNSMEPFLYFFEHFPAQQLFY